MADPQFSKAASSGDIRAETARVVVTIEARMTSSRLPGKVLLPIDDEGTPCLQMMVERLRRAQSVSEISIATTTNGSDDSVVELAGRLGVACHRGSEEDVLGRVLEAATSVGADIIVETTGDCPMIDPGLLDACVAAYFTTDVHYCANIRAEGLPRGLDVQVFSTSVLAEVARSTSDPADREHVSLFIYEHPDRYRLAFVPAPAPLYRRGWRWTLDTSDDLAFVRAVTGGLGRSFSARDATRWLDGHPEVVALNTHVLQKPVR